MSDETWDSGPLDKSEEIAVNRLQLNYKQQSVSGWQRGPSPEMLLVIKHTQAWASSKAGKINWSTDVSWLTATPADCRTALGSTANMLHRRKDMAHMEIFEEFTVCLLTGSICRLQWRRYRNQCGPQQDSQANDCLALGTGVRCLSYPDKLGAEWSSCCSRLKL